MSTMTITGPMEPDFDRILTPQALDFLAALHQEFFSARREILAMRETRRAVIGRGRMPDFKPQTAQVRRDRSWRVAAPAPGLEHRGVEIVSPACDIAAAHALGSGADVWIADLEDTMAPTWDNVITSQLNLASAVRGELTVRSRTTGAGRYVLTHDCPTIMVRPRGWHLPERHLAWVDDHGSAFPAIAAFVDFGLYLFHNAAALTAGASGPYFCLPKLEAAREAALWNAVFDFSESALGLAPGTIRATALIETLTAAFQADEILFELREHSAGLATGRWDFIFSMIRELRNDRRFILPDRTAIGSDARFMRALIGHVVRVCHRRGAQAIGGMSTFVPSGASAGNRAVREDKQAERALGLDGTWVSHRGLVPLAAWVFAPESAGRPTGPVPTEPGQTESEPTEAEVRAALLDVGDLSEVHPTEDGLRADIRLVLHYLNAWLSGTGMIEWDGEHQDASCAEICRAHIWQWIRHSVTLADGRTVTRRLVSRCVAEEMAVIIQHPADHYPEAVEALTAAMLESELSDFTTTRAYEQVLVHWQVKRNIAA